MLRERVQRVLDRLPFLENFGFLLVIVEWYLLYGTGFGRIRVNTVLVIDTSKELH